MPDGVLTEESKKKLDGIVQQMISNKESDANIQAVVDDFKSKYSQPEPEKTIEQHHADGTLNKPNPRQQFQDAAGITEQNKSEEPKQQFEPITQVGDEWQTESEAKTGIKEPQNDYLRTGVKYTPSEVKSLQTLANDYKDVSNEITYGLYDEDAAGLQATQQQLRNIKDAQETVITQAKFRDPSYHKYYDITQVGDNKSFKPVAMNDAELDSRLQQFIDESLSTWKDPSKGGEIVDSEFKGKKLSDLTPDEKLVLINQFNKRYIPAEGIQQYMKDKGISFDVSKPEQALSSAYSGIADVIHSSMQGLDLSKIPDADALNYLISQAAANDITKTQYEQSAAYQKKEILSKIEDHTFKSSHLLPGLTPQASIGVGKLKTYLYSDKQINDWLNKIPSYEDAKNGSPYKYENGSLGEAADNFERINNLFVRSNPKYEESLGLTVIPKLAGTLAAYAAAGTIDPYLAGAVGAVSMRGEKYNEAIQAGASGNDALEAAKGGTVAGSLYALPMGKYTEALATKLGLSEANIIAMTAAHGVGGFTQQALVTMTDNATAKALYDESRRVVTDVKDPALTNAAIAMLFHVIPAMMSKTAEVKGKDSEEYTTLKAAEKLITNKVENDAKNAAFVNIKLKEKPTETTATETVQTPAETVTEQVKQPSELEQKKMDVEGAITETDRQIERAKTKTLKGNETEENRQAFIAHLEFEKQKLTENLNDINGQLGATESGVSGIGKAGETVETGNTETGNKIGEAIDKIEAIESSDKNRIWKDNALDDLKKAGEAEKRAIFVHENFDEIVNKLKDKVTIDC